MPDDANVNTSIMFDIYLDYIEMEVVMSSSSRPERDTRLCLDLARRLGRLQAALAAQGLADLLLVVAGLATALAGSGEGVCGHF